MIQLQACILPFVVYSTIHCPESNLSSLFHLKLESNEISWPMIREWISSDDRLVFEKLFCVLFKAYEELKQDVANVMDWCDQHEQLLLSNIPYEEHWFSFANAVIEQNETTFITMFIQACTMKEKSEQNRVFSIFFCELFFTTVASHPSFLQSVLWLINNRHYLLTPPILCLLCNVLCRYCKKEVLLSVFSTFITHYDTHSMILSLALLYYSTLYHQSILIEHPSIGFVMQRTSLLSHPVIQVLRSRCLLCLPKSRHYGPPLWLVQNKQIQIEVAEKKAEEGLDWIAETVANTICFYAIDPTTLIQPPYTAFTFSVLCKCASLNPTYISSLSSLPYPTPVLLPSSTIQSLIQQNCPLPVITAVLTVNPTSIPSLLQPTFLSKLMDPLSNESAHLLLVLLQHCKHYPSLLSLDTIQSIYAACSSSLREEKQCPFRIHLIQILHLLITFYNLPFTPLQLDCFVDEIVSTLNHMDTFSDEGTYPIPAALQCFYDKQDISHDALYLLSLIPTPSLFISFAEFKQLIDETPQKEESSHYIHQPLENDMEMDLKKRRKEVFDNMLKQIEKIAKRSHAPAIHTFPFLSSTNCVHFIEYCIVLCCVHADSIQYRKTCLEWLHTLVLLFTNCGSAAFTQAIKEDGLIKHTLATVLQLCRRVLDSVGNDYKSYTDSVGDVINTVNDIQNLLSYLKQDMPVSKTSKLIQCVEASVSSVECIYNINFSLCYNKDYAIRAWK